MDETVSIIVPVYNVEKYLEKCIESILCQTYNNLEIILVNDGSTDSSLQICKKYADRDKRIEIIDKENEGLSIARQTGIDLCKGSFFSTTDADDYYDEQFVEDMLRIIKANNGDIVLCAKREIDEYEKYKEILLEDDIAHSYAVTPQELERNYTNICGIYQMSDSWNKMYRTEFVKQSGVKFKLQREYNGTDLLFNHMLLLHNPVLVAINKPLYNYRLTQNSRVRRKEKHLEIGFRIIYDTLVEECLKTINTKQMENQIRGEYLGMLKYATLDYYEEHKNRPKKSILDGFGEIIKSIPQFNIIQKINAIKEAPKGIKFFSIMLLLKNVNGLYNYYRLRDKIK